MDIFFLVVIVVVLLAFVGYVVASLRLERQKRPKEDTVRRGVLK